MADDSSSSKIQVPTCTPQLVNPTGAGPFILVCEHASKFIHAELNDLGLSGDVLDSHIAWDPGALAVALAMSEILDAPLIAQNVSRLVYDCNRPPEAESAIPMTSEVYAIPGNADLSETERRDRIERYYLPFRQKLSDIIDSRSAMRRTGTELPILVTIHSFTPVYFGERRETEIGILHDADSRLADAMLNSSENNRQVSFNRNKPYGPGDGVTHTLVEHAAPRGLLNVMIEIRNDLVASPSDQHKIAEILSRMLSEASTAAAVTPTPMEQESRVEGVR